MIGLKNSNYYPFERNKYFYGKLLSVADFELEQKYMNDKRRFLSRYLFGPGVVCGLNTYSVDDNSLMMEAGSAIDGAGREIVVGESIIRKLSAIDGYDATTGNVLYLCIEYNEDFSDPVYSLAHTSGDMTKNASEFNRIKESFHLYLTDREPQDALSSPMDDFITKRTVFSNKDVTVIQSVPRIVSGLAPFNVHIDIVKHHANASLSFEYTIDTPYFNTENGSNTILVSYKDLPSNALQSHRLTYTLTPPSSVQTETVLTIDPNSMNFSLQNEAPLWNDSMTFDIQVVPAGVSEMLERKYFSFSLESPSRSKHNTPICLSEIEIFRSSNAYIIEKVKAMPFNQYVCSPQLTYLLNQLDGFFPPLRSSASASSGLSRASLQKGSEEVYPSPESLNASGVIEIPLGFNARAKQKFFSEEIMHGLGKGSVTVILGIEASAANENLPKGALTAYGNPEIFQDSGHTVRLPNCEIGALSYEERGTFVVGVRLLEATASLSLNVRWYAFKNPAPSVPSDHKDGCLFIKPDTIVVSPRATAYFKAIFYNTEETPCNWRVVEEDGGTIEPNGVYTAPNKEGVFEINVESISNPALKATAFVIVKEKGAAE